MNKQWIWLAFFTMLTSSTLLSCGGGGGGEEVGSTTAPLSSIESSEVGGSCDGAVPMPASLEGTWNETSQCAGMSSVPPSVIFSPTVTCPRNGESNCLATVPFFPCSSDPSQTCGAVGRFLPACNAIELPDRNTGAAAHEMIHYLLHASGRRDWASHSAPEFVCQ